VDPFRVWPNPVDATLYINITVDTASAVIVKLFDSKGAIVRQQAGNLFPGNNLMTLNLQSLSSGAYFLNILYNNGQLRVRGIIKK